MHRLVVASLVLVVGCGPQRPPDEPSLPPTPIRVAVAELNFARWNGSVPRRDMRAALVSWVDGWHGLAIDRAVPPALRTSSTIGQSDALESVRAACDAARALGVDALLYGDVVYDELVVHACERHGGTTHDLGGECTRYSEDKIASSRVDLMLHLVVVHADTCGFDDVVVDGNDRDRHAAPRYIDPWEQLRLMSRKLVPDGLHRPPRFAP